MQSIRNGHHKAEYFSAVLEGVLIVVASVAILREAYSASSHPDNLDAPWLGLAVNAAALPSTQDGLGTDFARGANENPGACG